jgi:hypothetical protein
MPLARIADASGTNENCNGEKQIPFGDDNRKNKFGLKQEKQIRYDVL